jgi:hypothetical protein
MATTKRAMAAAKATRGRLRSLLLNEARAMVAARSPRVPTVQVIPFLIRHEEHAEPRTPAAQARLEKSVAAWKPKSGPAEWLASLPPVMATDPCAGGCGREVPALGREDVWCGPDGECVDADERAAAADERRTAGLYAVGAHVPRQLGALRLADVRPFRGHGRAS